MTQAFNLSQFANSVNTSGQASLTTGVTGTLPVANGGTGAATLTANNVLLGNGTSAVQVVAPGSNGNILTSNGTTWVSSTPAGGGVTSLNGQTGAITNTGSGNIGSYYAGFGLVNTGYSIGGTIAGSDLRYGAVVSGTNYGGFSQLFTSNSAVDVTMNSQTNLTVSASSGFSGTWRCMTHSGGTPTLSRSQFNLWVRIS